MQVTFPSGKVFARQNNVIKCQRTADVDSTWVQLSIGGITSKRYFPYSGNDDEVLYFPLDGFLQALICEENAITFGVGEIVVSFTSDGDPTTIANESILIAVNGASEFPFASVPTSGELGFPQPKKIPIYPTKLTYNVPAAINKDSAYLCVIGADYYAENYSEYEAIMASVTELDAGKILYFGVFLKLIWVSGAMETEETDERKIREYSTAMGNDSELTSAMLASLNENSVNELVIRKSITQSDTENHQLNYTIDECTDGIFVRWFDIYGYTMHFRFTEKEKSDAVKNTQTINSFTDELKEQKKRNRSWTRLLTVTSQLVDADTFDWLRRLPLGRNIQVLDGTTWRDAYCEDVTISGTNEMNALTITLSIDNLTPQI